MSSSNDYFEVESHRSLGVLKMRPFKGVALADIGYAHAVMDAIKAFEAASKSTILVCVPSGNFAPGRMDVFWEAARDEKPDEQNLAARFVHPTAVPIQVLRLEAGVVQLLSLLQKTKLFKIIAVEGDIDFDLLGLLLAFDVRWCSRSTVFQNRIIDRGANPGFGVLWYVTKLIGHSGAVDLILNQRSLNADEAIRLKLVTHQADDHALVDEAFRHATDIADKPRAVLEALAKAREILTSSFESYINQFGGGFTQLPPS